MVSQTARHHRGSMADQGPLLPMLLEEFMADRTKL